MINSVVGQPMVNAGTLYINGLRVSWVDGTHLTVAPGACRDATNENDIVLSSTATLNTAVQGVNGLDIGTMANNTFYAVYVIGSSLYAQPAVDIEMQRLNGVIIPAPLSNTTNNYPPAVIISATLTAPQLPAGYDMYRRIGFVKTNGAAALLQFWQTGGDNARKMWYDTSIQVLNAGASAAYAAVSLATAVPAAAGQTAVTFSVALDPTAAEDTVNLRPTGSNSTPGIAIMSGDATGVLHTDSIDVPAAISAGNLSIDYKVVGTVSLNVTAYVDNL